jgi:hypothetical protein
MTLKDIFDKKIGELTVREFIAFDSYLNDKHRVNDTEWITIDEAASLMRRSRRSFEKDYMNKVTSTKIGGRRLINKESVLRIIEQKNEAT